MAATPGNQWWRLRTKHGVDALFTEPEKLWEAAVEYFEHTDKRKWKKKDWVGKDATEVIRESDAPYTITSLCLYLGVTDAWWRGFKTTDTFKNNKDFGSVYESINQIIYSQKFEGASVGAFNANIIARDLGLREKTELSTPEDGSAFKVTINIGDKSDSPPANLSE